MTKFVLKTIIIYGSIALAIILLINFFNLITFSQSEIVLENGRPFQLKLRETLTQKFTAKRDGLSRIQFLLSSIEINKGDRVKIELADESCKNILRKDLLRKTPLSSEGLYEFTFKQIPDSNQKIYCIKATMLESQEIAEPIEFFTTETAYFRFLAKNETTLKTSETHLSIRPGYRNKNIFQDLNEINQRISQYKPWFLKNYFISIALILMLTLSAKIILILIKNLE